MTKTNSLQKGCWTCLPAKAGGNEKHGEGIVHWICAGPTYASRQVWNGQPELKLTNELLLTDPSIHRYAASKFCKILCL